jgi:hypothetical protein
MNKTLERVVSAATFTVIITAMPIAVGSTIGHASRFLEPWSAIIAACALNTLWALFVLKRAERWILRRTGVLRLRFKDNPIPHKIPKGYRFESSEGKVYASVRSEDIPVGSGELFIECMRVEA